MTQSTSNDLNIDTMLEELLTEVDRVLDGGAPSLSIDDKEPNGPELRMTEALQPDREVNTIFDLCGPSVPPDSSKSESTAIYVDENELFDLDEPLHLVDGKPPPTIPLTDADVDEIIGFELNVASLAPEPVETWNVGSSSLKNMQELAERRGGRCLSTEYVDGKSDLIWSCKVNHEWAATPNNVQYAGSWCPHCRTNAGEEMVRATLVEAFPGHAFDRTRRVPWMEKLELDGYNEELKLAFEYQGIQHYRRVPYFHRKEGDFESQQVRDALTAERCRNNQVDLLIVPYTVKFVNIRKTVRALLLELGRDIAPMMGSDTDFYDGVRASGTNAEKLYTRACAVVARKGGILVSKTCSSVKSPLTIICKENHEFVATLADIDQSEHRGPRFCPPCGGTMKQSDETLRARVEACGWQFISAQSELEGTRYRRKLLVRCPAGHTRDMYPENLLTTEDGTVKKGCKECFTARNGASKRTDIRNWCAKNGIQILGEYKSRITPARWMCSAGHQFTTTMAKMTSNKARCRACGLLKYAEENNLELMTKWKETDDPASTLYTWRCRECDYTRQASAMNLGKITNMCEYCFPPKPKPRKAKK